MCTAAAHLLLSVVGMTWFTEAWLHLEISSLSLNMCVGFMIVGR